MQQRLNSDDNDELYFIAPVTQHVEREDENEGNQDLHPDFNEGYDLSDDLGIPSRQQVLQPVFDGYVFNDIQDSEYSILSPNLWKKYLRMYELKEIMRQRESKIFAEILNRLREGKHTDY
ncbi:Hypothetical predicted protein [Paramuricea clavata]|uniref:Uncharacterized protein n=1 Tax=Paramuricea clavata TaxID=317549 RepID=A0A7D9HZT6_PARCT|nr:Hypothetical predicted protein [Paramuricea clavata]